MARPTKFLLNQKVNAFRFNTKERYIYEIQVDDIMEVKLLQTVLPGVNVELPAGSTLERNREALS